MTTPKNGKTRFVTMTRRLAAALRKHRHLRSAESCVRTMVSRSPGQVAWSRARYAPRRATGPTGSSHPCDTRSARTSPCTGAAGRAIQDRAPPRACAGDRCHRSPAVSIDLEDPARARTVRGTRAGGQRGGEEGARAQDDPRTAKSRLSRRTSPGSFEQPGMIGRDFRPWLITAA
jgi:hypothetical protein